MPIKLLHIMSVPISIDMHLHAHNRHIPQYTFNMLHKSLNSRACRTNENLFFLNSGDTLKSIKLYPPLKMLSIPDSLRLRREGDEHLLNQFTEH